MIETFFILQERGFPFPFLSFHLAIVPSFGDSYFTAFDNLAADGRDRDLRISGNWNRVDCQYPGAAAPRNRYGKRSRREKEFDTDCI
jgi:hypothetical protein